MESKEFIPQYTKKIKFAILICSALAIFSLIFLILKEPISIKEIVTFLIFPVVVPFGLKNIYKKIELNDNIVAYRYLLPSKIISINNISDIGAGLVKATDGKLVTKEIENAESFYELLRNHIETNKFNNFKVSGELIYANQITTISFPIALICYLMCHLGLIYFDLLPDEINGKLFGGILFFVWFCVIYFGIKYLKRRNEAL